MSFSAIFSSVALVITCTIAYLFWFDGISELHRFNLMDKAAHFLGFFLINGVLYALTRIPQRLLLPGLVFYAALTEIGQWLLGFRAAQWGDFFADTAGCLTFTLLYFIFVKLTQLKNAGTVFSVANKENTL